MIDYQKMRLAQDLSKSTLETLGLMLMKTQSDGSYKKPTLKEVVALLNKMARERRIQHYILRGEYEEVILFDKDHIIYDMKVYIGDYAKGSRLVPIQCYDEPVDSSDPVPRELGALKELKRLPKLSSGTCVYFLCYKRKVVYVGQTTSLHSRLTSHYTDKVFDEVYYLQIPVHQLQEVESAFISYLRPKYNNTTQILTEERKAIVKEHMFKLEKP